MRYVTHVKTFKPKQIHESAKPGALRVRMQDTRRFVEGNLRELQKLLNAEPRMARAELAKHIQTRIVLKPGGKAYVAVGDWNLLGVVSYDGAGGGKWTERLPIHFEWLAAA